MLPAWLTVATSMNDVTRILSAIEQADPKAPEQLLVLVYDELRKLAAQRLARESPGQTLQATALVHEAYLRLIGPAGSGPHWNSRGHFFAAAAEAKNSLGGLLVKKFSSIKGSSISIWPDINKGTYVR